MDILEGRFTSPSFISSFTPIRCKIKLPAIDWKESENPNYPYEFILYDDVFRAERSTEIYPSPESIEDFFTFGVSSATESEDGIVTMYALNKPTTDIRVNLITYKCADIKIGQLASIRWIGYYGNNKAVLKVPGYNLLILESDSIGKITDNEKTGKKVLAYIAIAEIVTGRWFWPLCEGKDFLVDKNNTWGSIRINPASEEWQDILLNTVAPLILEERNYDGVFFDVVGTAEVLESTDPVKYAGAIQGTTNIIKAFKDKYPDKLIACNDGYRPVLDARDAVDYYVIESAIGTWVTVDGKVEYRPSSSDRKNWLDPRVSIMMEAGLPILDWEYGDVTDIASVTDIKNEAIEKGWNPFVTNRDISWFPLMDTLPPEIVYVTPPMVKDPNDPNNWTPAKDRISFIGAAEYTDLDFFSGKGYVLPSSDKFRVFINGEATDQKYTALTFNEDDRVDIQLLDDSSYYPPFVPGHWDVSKRINAIKEILEPFPPFYTHPSRYVFSNGANMFTYCGRLKKVCEKLFINNPKINSAYYMFALSGLTEVPEKLFEGLGKVTTFEECFSNCSYLTEVASDVFEYSTIATNMVRVFYNDNKLPMFNIKIGSPNVTKVTDFVTSHWQSTTSNRVVNVPAGSTTAETFSNVTLPALGVVEYE